MRQYGAKAEFKRQLTLNSVWYAFNHISNTELGIRSVSIVQTNAVAFKTTRGNSYLRWDDREASYTNPALGVFQVYDGNSLVLTYQLQLTKGELK